MKRLFIALLLPVVLIGCASDDNPEPEQLGMEQPDLAQPDMEQPEVDEPEVQAVASLEGSEPVEGEERETSTPQFEQGLLLFTACMREQGVEVPDIPVDPDGRPILSSDLVQRIDTESPEFAAAFARCVPFLTASSPVALGADPELQAVVIDALRRFSVCMRNNGVENFPDPAPGWDGNGSPYPVAEAFDTSDPEVDLALKECSGLITAPSVG